MQQNVHGNLDHAQTSWPLLMMLLWVLLQMFGKVEVPKEAFTSILKINSDAA